MEPSRDQALFLDQCLTVQAVDSGQRLDNFLSRQFPQLSRSHFKRLIHDCHVLVNGTPCKPSYEIREGDRISVQLPAASDDGVLAPHAMPLEILYEDEDLIAVNKAPGVVVHPGAGSEERTLVHGLLAHCSHLSLQGSPNRPGIVHRLDKDTSGALVVAKSEAAYLSLVSQFKEHTVEKNYRALVYGRFSQPSGEIHTLMDRHSEHRKKMAVVQGRGREAVSSWQVEREFGEVTLTQVAIRTGRTHQIRVHLSYVGHPVVGDEVYGGGKRRLRSLRSKPLQDVLSTVSRQLLHAWRLTLLHPKTRTPLTLIAPLPPDFATILERLDGLASRL